MNNRKRNSLISNVDFSREGIILGLKLGRALIELKTCDPVLHRWIEELIHEGIAHASEWHHKPETGEIYRTITRKPLKPGSFVRKDA